MSRKNSMLIGIIILMSGLIVLGILIAKGVKTHNNEPKLFKDSKKVLAMKIYENIKAYDLEESYPDTPEKVMDLYMNLTMLILGDMIQDNNVYAEMVDISRKLYSDEILASNPVQQQYQELISSVKALEKDEIYLAQFDRGKTYYPPDNSKLCVIPVDEYLNKIGHVYWNYYLVSEEGAWKIQTWEMTDENYNSLNKK